jgi:hypothetical protein
MYIDIVISEEEVTACKNNQEKTGNIKREIGKMSEKD